MKIEAIWQASLSEAQKTLESLLQSPQILNQLTDISKLMVDTLKKGGKIFSCGNGGSHCDAMHFAEELTGRYRKDRIPLGALALGDPSHLTCVGNDYGFEHVFARQLTALARPNDLFFVISTSGNSKNQINAVEAARKIPIKSIALLGRNGGVLKELCDLSVVVPGPTSDRIQELHIKVIHILVEVIERELFPDHYS